jgi:hypothetical protein
MSLQMFNRKNQTPSIGMLPPDGRSYACDWIHDSITLHADGNVTCGLDDPHGQRSFGNAYTDSVATIFANPEYATLQARLRGGHRCADCGHFRPISELADVRGRPRARLPVRLVVEPTVLCNIRCLNPVCGPNNEAGFATRDSNLLDDEAFRRVVDELHDRLSVVCFYNYGEPFVHPRAEDMLLYLRRQCPTAHIVTSTNGIPLATAARAEKVALAQPDHMVFTISGVTQEAYAKYHVRGNLEKALAGMSNVCAAKRSLGNPAPRVTWRYLVFRWNDSDEEIDTAIDMARRIGVDELSLYLTDTPPGARSVRFSPGSPSYFKYHGLLHRDHEGRLDHAYHCELPDPDGMYHIEQLPNLGSARWTGSRAVTRRTATRGRFRISVATARGTSAAGEHTCRVTAPWGAWTVPVRPGRWQVLDKRVPRRYRGPEGFEVEITTDDYWFPAVENGTPDLRCLGVLVDA